MSDKPDVIWLRIDSRGLPVIWLAKPVPESLEEPYVRLDAVLDEIKKYAEAVEHFEDEANAEAVRKVRTLIRQMANSSQRSAKEEYDGKQ